MRFLPETGELKANLKHSAIVTPKFSIEGDQREVSEYVKIAENLETAVNALQESARENDVEILSVRISFVANGMATGYFSIVATGKEKKDFRMSNLQKPALSRIEKIYELVDTSDDESYHTLGLFLTYDEALVCATTESKSGGPQTELFDDFARLEIRQREIGYAGWSKVGTTLAEVDWTSEWNDEGEHAWRHSVRSRDVKPCH